MGFGNIKMFFFYRYYFAIVTNIITRYFFFFSVFPATDFDFNSAPYYFSTIFIGIEILRRFQVYYYCYCCIL